jgi:lysophospholipase L1-like esterase
MKSRLTAAAAATAVAALAAVVSPGPIASAAAAGHPVPGWSAAWASAMQQPVPSNPTTGPNWSDGFAGQTLRQVIRVTGAGSRVRIRLSNLYGSGPLRVTGATIARTGTGAAVEPGTVRSLTFHRARSVTIPAGQVTASDPAALPVAPLESLTVTLFFAGPTGPATFHEDGQAVSYRADGDHRFDTGAAAFGSDTSHSFYYLTGVDVAGADGAGGTGGTVVAFGDSITNGHNSTAGGNDRYPDALADRLAAAHRPLAVVNAGISGNTLLNGLPCFGEKGLTRFQRDALSQPGVRTVIFGEGENDIWDSEGNYGLCGTTPRITAAQLIAGYQTLIRAAHARGIRIIGATITPFKAPYISDAAFQRAEAIRDQVNDWIRTSGAFDAVADFAQAVADPADPAELSPAYNSGDYLHPNDAGYRAIAAVINLSDL